LRDQEIKQKEIPAHQKVDKKHIA